MGFRVAIIAPGEARRRVDPSARIVEEAQRSPARKAPAKPHANL